jgi:hypothetical protein
MHVAVAWGQGLLQGRKEGAGDVAVQERWVSAVTSTLSSDLVYLVNIAGYILEYRVCYV